MAYAHCVKSKLGLKCGLLCLLKVTPMPWGQSQDKGEVPERRKRSPYGTPCIFISSAWMRTSQGCSCLGSTGDSSVGGANVSVRSQAFHTLAFEESQWENPLQTFIDLLVNHGSVSSFSKGEVRGGDERLNYIKVVVLSHGMMSLIIYFAFSPASHTC